MSPRDSALHHLWQNQIAVFNRVARRFDEIGRLFTFDKTASTARPDLIKGAV